MNAHGRVLGVPHIVARANSNGELSYGEEVQDVDRVSVGLELAAGGVVRGVLGVVLVHPALEKAEPILCVQAAPDGVGRRWLQVHHVRVRHNAVDTAVIFDGDRAGIVGLSANAGDEEREDHLEVVVEEE